MKAHKARRYCGIGNSRINDPYIDRRSGEEMRQYYTPAYFDKNGMERRVTGERRINVERRKGCGRVSTWASVCYTAAR